MKHGAQPYKLVDMAKGEPAKQKKNTPRTAWKPGQSGNPKGRPPKGDTMTEALKEKVDKEAVAEKLYAMAMEGDIAALKYIYDRVDGKPRESVDLNHSGGINVTIGKDFRGL